MVGLILMDLKNPLLGSFSTLMTSWVELFCFLWMTMGRERELPSLIMSTLDQTQPSREDKLRFKLKVDGEQLDDLISFNQLMESLENTLDTGQTEDGLYKFKPILDHRGPDSPSDPEYLGSRYNLLIEWETGVMTWEPLSNIIADNPYSCAVYAKKLNLLNTQG